MIENIVVFIIIAIAVFMLGRRIYLTISAKDASCGCAGCSNSLSCESKDSDRESDLQNND